MSFPIIAGAVALGGSLLGAAQEDGQSKAAHAAQVEMSRRQVVAARESALDDFAALGRREREESQKVAQEIEYLSRDARTALGAEKVGQAAAGVGGNTAEAVQRDYERAAAEAATATLISERNQRAALRDAAKGVSSQLRAQEIGATVAPRRKVNWFTAATGALSSGLSTYSMAGGKFATPDDGLDPKKPK